MPLFKRQPTTSEIIEKIAIHEDELAQLRSERAGLIEVAAFEVKAERRLAELAADERSLLGTLEILAGARRRAEVLEAEARCRAEEAEQAERRAEVAGIRREIELKASAIDEHFAAVAGLYSEIRERVYDSIRLDATEEVRLRRLLNRAVFTRTLKHFFYDIAELPASAQAACRPLRALLGDSVESETDTTAA